MASSASSIHVMSPGREARVSAFGMKYSSVIVVAVSLMLVALLYVGLHIRMTQMEYAIAAAMNEQGRMLEQQRQLKLEFATLKSPERIERIAMQKLQMIYPDREQVIVLKTRKDAK